MRQMATCNTVLRRRAAARRKALAACAALAFGVGIALGLVPHDRDVEYTAQRVEKTERMIAFCRAERPSDMTELDCLNAVQDNLIALADSK